jgi:hypothetical protein
MLFRKARCFAPLEPQILVSRFYKYLVPSGLKTRANRRLARLLMCEKLTDTMLAEIKSHE